ncbi:MAG TPA: tetratricopeptide repeat protein [Thermoanaerobaculia bacterium]|nr:tetratricopeptide repeat protein [Thermoanaerobaculia bacterium]
MVNFRNFRRPPESAGKRKTESERLDNFLGDLADPGLLQSLREDEQRRRRIFLLAGALILGLVLGGVGMLMSLPAWKSTPLSVLSHGGSAEELARVLANQSLQLYKGKQIERALSHARLATALAPGLADGWDALALALFYGGQTVEAEKAARKCLEISPGYSRAFHMLGDFNFYTGDWKQAERYWRQAGSDAQRGLVRLLLLENRMREAAPLVQQLARRIPDDRYIRIMSEAVRLGRVTPELRRKLAPDFVASRNADTAQGWRLFYQRRYEEASATFSQAISRDPRDGSALIGRGWCLLRIGTPREAQSAFEQALATWPTSYSALNGLAWSRKAQGQTESALALWHQVVDELPRVDQMEVPDCLKGLGTVYYDRGDYPRANFYLASSMLKNPFDPEAAALLQSTLGKLQAPPAAESPGTR